MPADIRAIVAAAVKVRDEGENLAKLLDRRDALQQQNQEIQPLIAQARTAVNQAVTQLRSVLDQP